MPSLGANDLSITIRAVDEASPALRKVAGNVDSLGSSSARGTSLAERLRSSWAPIAAVTAAAGVGFVRASSAIDDVLSSANKLNNAMTGLNTVSRYYGQDAGRATEAAKSLAKDGLMTVTDAAAGLKNLLQSGFSLPQAIQIMNRFKDTAAFGRQGALEFGQAIVGATEGIRNGNSILSDNAGMTKNLSQILVEAGYSQQDLSKASSDAGVRMALYNGIIKETAPQVGDASRLAGQFAGKQAQAAAATETLKQKIGLSLQTAFAPLLAAITPLIQHIANWVEHNQKLTAAIAIGITVFLGLATVIGAIAGVIALVGAGAAVVFGGIIVLVAAVVAALIVYWQPISGFFTSLWNGIGATIGTVFRWIGDRVDWLKNHFWEAVGFIIGFFATLPIKLPIFVFQAISAIVRWLAGVNWGAVFAAIGRTFGSVWDSIKNVAKAALNWLIHLDWGAIGRGFAKGLIGLVEGAINGALAGLPGGPKVHFPRFATGTNFAPGGLALVGENGPELVNLPRGSQVKTASQTRAALSDAPGGPKVVVNGGVHIHNDLDPILFFEDMGWRLSLQS